MDENVIFSQTGNKPAEPQSNTQPVQPAQPQTPPQPEVPSVEPVSTQPMMQQPPTSGGTPPPTEPPLPKPPQLSFFERLPKIVFLIPVVLLVLALVIFVVMPLFGSKNKDEDVTLTYWGLFEDKQAMDVIIADFQRQHPNIKVNYVRKDVKQYRKSLVTQLENGTGPDIYRFHNSWLGMMQNYLSPMNADVIAPDEFKDNYFPVVQQDMTKNGALYGLPLGIDTLALFVNTELFQAGGNSVPKTWDEFIKVAKDRVVKDTDGKIRTAGAALGTYDNITHAPDILALLMAQNGTNFSDFNSTVANAEQALEFYSAFAQGEGSVWDSTLDASLTAFAKGNLAMYFGYSWDIYTIKALNPELQFSIHPVPNLPGRKMAIASYWAEGVSSKSKHQKEAMLFMQYLAQKVTLQKLYSETSKVRLFGDLYPRKDLAQTIMNNSLARPFVEQAAYATSSYFSSDTYDEGINEQMNAYLGNAVRSSAETTSLKTAMETLAQGVTQVLSKYGR